MSDENAQAPAGDVEILDRIQNSLFGERPRGPDGKFAKSAPELVEEALDAPLPEEKAEAQPEGEDAPEDPVEETTAAPDEEEVNWDDLKEYKVKVPMKNGAQEWEEEVTLEQLRNERLMRNDYNQKVQQLQTERTQVTQQVQQFQTQVRDQAIRELQTYEAALLHSIEPQFQNVDFNRLAVENPAEWARMAQLQANVSQTLNALRGRMTQLQQAQEQDLQLQRAQAARTAAEEVAKRIPGWSDEVDKSLAKYVMERGLKAEYVQSGQVPIADATVLELAWKAQQWDQLQSQKPAVTKKVNEAPKVLKPGAKRDPGQDRATQQSELKKVVGKTGGKGERGEAALAAFLRNRMFGG